MFNIVYTRHISTANRRKSTAPTARRDIRHAATTQTLAVRDRALDTYIHCGYSNEFLAGFGVRYEVKELAQDSRVTSNPIDVASAPDDVTLTMDNPIRCDPTANCARNKASDSASIVYACNTYVTERTS